MNSIYKSHFDILVNFFYYYARMSSKHMACLQLVRWFTNQMKRLVRVSK